MKYDFSKNAAKNGAYGKKYSWEEFAEKAERLFCPREDYIPMWIADMDFPTAPEIVAAITDASRAEFLGYTVSNRPEYRRIMQDWFSRRYGWDGVRPEQIFTAGGVISSLEVMLKHAVEPGKKVMILTPSYSPFAMSILGAGCQIDTVPLQNDQGRYSVDWENFEAHVRDPEVRAFILCSPHNPSGRVWTEEELRRMGELCFSNGVYVFSDEIHCDMLRVGSRHIPFGKLFPHETRWAVCNAPSKSFNMGGMHISSIVMPDRELAAAWAGTEWWYCTNPISLAAAEAAYSRCDAWLDAARAHIDRNFSLVDSCLKERLPKAVFHVPEGTYLAWIDISAYRDVVGEKDVTTFFIENSRVVLEGGEGFIGGTDDHIRLNLATSYENVRAATEGVCRALCAK